MKAIIQAGGEEDLEETFNYYESLRSGLGHEFIDEFRRAVQRMLDPTVEAATMKVKLCVMSSTVMLLACG